MNIIDVRKVSEGFGLCRILDVSVPPPNYPPPLSPPSLPPPPPPHSPRPRRSPPPPPPQPPSQSTNSLPPLTPGIPMTTMDGRLDSDEFGYHNPMQSATKNAWTTQHSFTTDPSPPRRGLLGRVSSTLPLRFRGKLSR
ncbi:MAG: hypothetical protein NXY57DRAFT_966835 [Lentinula lateritia]|nr:MAG: hypothetical protein NXY57DRAFT_966835 [Lentinula lateritia]